MTSEHQINSRSSISLSLAITLCGVAFSGGALWIKINTFENKLIALEYKIDQVIQYQRNETLSFNKP
jgi:hypothetical protein